MTRRFRTILTANILILTVALTACAPNLFRTLKAALDLAGPFVSSLGIGPAITGPIITDFADATRVAGAMNDAFNVATTGQQKFAAASVAYDAWLVIYHRGHFGADPRVLRVADSVGYIFKAITDYYNPGGPPRSMSEKDFAKSVQVKIDALKRQMK